MAAGDGRHDVAGAPAGPTRFRLADLPAQPWKNGGGLTREVACWPPGAGLDDFVWRISVARIDAGGPFSRFAGVDRVITLLSGPGVVLRGGFAAGEHALTRPLAPFAFSGDVDVQCTLQGGTSEDFNVMSRRGRVQARVSVIQHGGDLPRTPHGLLMAVGSRWQVQAGHGAEYELAPDTGLWWAASDHGWRVRPAGTTGLAPGTGLIAVAIAPQAPNDQAREVTRGQEAT
ncbi:hypothetical protein AKI39_10090 [Bordetella sp. H567]|nr:hypothetical protein AKI39_10090 [Bordetella sp. H567]